MEVKTSRLTYLLPPAPTVLISTIDKNGRRNIATYDSNMLCCKKPPMIAVAVREFQHTYRNIRETGEFVVGIPPFSIAYEVWKCGNKDEKCDDEFMEVGLTPIPSEKVTPFRMKECQVNLECRLEKDLKLGSNDFTFHLILGNVIIADIQDKLFSEDNIELRRNLDSIYHISKTHFVKKGKEIEPKTT